MNPETVVGNAFAIQYYNILHTYPEMVCKFYQDSSVLSRPDVEGVMTSVKTMQCIKEKIISWNFKDYKAEIKTVDSQQSYMITVLVSGCLIGKDNLRRNFAQSFFLAPQEKGYFVLNDVFRFVEGDEELQNQPNNSAANVQIVLSISNPGQCDYDVEKLADRFSECTSQTSNSEARDSKRDHGHKSFGQAFTKCKAPSSSSLQRNELDLLQNSELQSSILKMQTRSQRADTDGIYSSVNSKECNLLRGPARQHWILMQSYKKRAAQAYSRGKPIYAALLSNLADVERNLARAADDKASQEIFKARNKNIENWITIDLHGQQIEPAIKLLKNHLRCGINMRSIQTLRVITGRGKHNYGKCKLKESVIAFLKKEGIEWEEENKGSLLIKLDQKHEYSLLDEERYTE